MVASRLQSRETYVTKNVLEAVGVRGILAASAAECDRIVAISALTAAIRRAEVHDVARSSMEAAATDAAHTRRDRLGRCMFTYQSTIAKSCFDYGNRLYHAKPPSLIHVRRRTAEPGSVTRRFRGLSNRST